MARLAILGIRPWELQYLTVRELRALTKALKDMPPPGAVFLVEPGK